MPSAAVKPAEAAEAAVKAAHSPVKPSRHAVKSSDSMHPSRTDRGSMEKMRGSADPVEHAPVGKTRGAVKEPAVSQAGGPVERASMP